MSDVKITVNRNGPYIVQGEVTVTDHKGNEVKVEGDQLELCRCGASQNKPFCDGSHKDIEFKGDKAAVAEENLVQNGD